MNGFLQTLRGLGPARLVAVGAVGLGLLVFFIFLATRLQTTDMALLYGELDMTDSAEIAGQLDQMGVPYEVQGNGATIMVPSDQVDRLRLAMARSGLPSGGSIGYEIFDQSDGFGTTSFVQNINRLRAMEGELARTVSSIAGVRSARVHLVLPERELFSRDVPEPTASVVVTLDSSGLTGEQILSIRQLVAAAVPRLEPSNISVVDHRGQLLARGPGGDDEALQLANNEQMRRDYERRLTEKVEELVARSVGWSNVRAEVAVDMDFDRVVINEERYDPDSQVARSTQFVEEEESSSDSTGPDPVTVAETLPEAEQQAPLAGGGSTDERSRIEETVNYEINRTVSETVREVGRVQRMSVAVMVDGTYVENAEGQMEFVERPEAQLASIDALVRSAVGFDAQRGDTVEVVSMRFAETEEEAAQAAAAGTLMGLDRADLFRLAEILVLGIVAVLVILLVVRPLIGRLVDGQGAAEGPRDEFDMLTGGIGPQPALAGPGAGGIPELAGPRGTGLATTGLGGGGAEEESELDAMIDIDQVEGRVRASSLKKVGEIIEKHPEEAVSIIRNWMYQEA
ncbi:MAG: flagellar basal-body MS-ring/collar protein FliF [Azospirillaceae bacterium]